MVLRTKALVVGGGPAGATAAQALAKEGVDTILVQKDLSYVKPCGGGVPSGACREFDIPPMAVKNIVRSSRVVSPAGETYEIPHEESFIAIVDRGVFDSELRARAEGSGAGLMEGTFMRFIETNGDAITAEIALDGRSEIIKADYVIAADGVDSRIRRALGMARLDSIFSLSLKAEIGDTEGRASKETFPPSLSGGEPPGPPGPGGSSQGHVSPSSSGGGGRGKGGPPGPEAPCEFWFGSSHARRGYSWVFPQAEGTVSIGTVCSPGKGAADMFRRFLTRRGLGHIGGRPQGFRIPIWKDSPTCRGNVILAGDAAGHVMPLIFEGIYYAMMSGRFAAEAVLAGRPRMHRMLWRERFGRKFKLIRILWSYYLRNDARTERLVGTFKDPEAQKKAIGIWLGKSTDEEGFASFATLFGKTVLWP